MAENDFKQAEQIMFDLVKKEIKELPEDYYLFSFDDKELEEIMIHPNDWNELDQLLAKQLLNDRNIEFSEDKINSIQLAEQKKQFKTDSIPMVRIIFCYLFILTGIFFKILLIILVFVIAQGYILMSSKKKLPNNERSFQYSPTTRIHGQIIFFFGILIFIAWVVIFIAQLLNIDPFIHWNQ